MITDTTVHTIVCPLTAAQQKTCMECLHCSSRSYYSTLRSHYSTLAASWCDLGWREARAGMLEHGWIELTEYAGFVLPCSEHRPDRDTNLKQAVFSSGGDYCNIASHEPQQYEGPMPPPHVPTLESPMSRLVELREYVRILLAEIDRVWPSKPLQADSYFRRRLEAMLEEKP